MLKRSLRIALILATLPQVALPGGTPNPTHGPTPRNRRIDAPGQKVPTPEPSACDLALDACKSLVEAQDKEITQLKSDQGKLAKSLVDAENRSVLPTLVWVTVGVVIGAALGSRLLR